MIKAGQTITPTDFVLALTAGESLAARDACYIDSADGKVYKCDADDLNKLHFGGFAQEAAVLNAAVNLVPDGFLGGFSGLTIGALYYVSGTAGAITTTRPTNAVLTGRAVSATQIKIFSGFTRINRIVYTTTGANTWTKRAGLAQIFVRVQAAGGGSGTAGNGFTGGGGGGAYTEGFLFADSLGSTETATVGAGGLAGVVGGTTTGGTGGTSSFGTHLVCTGGVGTARNSNGGGAGGTVSTAGSFSVNGGNGAMAIGNDDGSATAGWLMPCSGVGFLSVANTPNQEGGNDRDYGGPTAIGYGWGGGIRGQDSQPSDLAGQVGGQGIIIVDEYYFF